MDHARSDTLPTRETERCAGVKQQQLLEPRDNGAQDPAQASSGSTGSAAVIEKRLQSNRWQPSRVDPRDPLGLLEWEERVRRRGLVVLKVLGGCGVVGAVAVWITRSWWSGGDDGLFLGGGWSWNWFGGWD